MDSEAYGGGSVSTDCVDCSKPVSRRFYLEMAEYVDDCEFAPEDGESGYSSSSRGPGKGNAGMFTRPSTRKQPKPPLLLSLKKSRSSSSKGDREGSVGALVSTQP